MILPKARKQKSKSKGKAKGVLFTGSLDEFIQHGTNIIENKLLTSKLTSAIKPVETNPVETVLEVEAKSALVEAKSVEVEAKQVEVEVIEENSKEIASDDDYVYLDLEKEFCDVI